MICMNEKKLYEIKFKRKYSVNPRKTLRMPLGEMSMHTNWIASKRGDPYPCVYSIGSAEEITGDGTYRVKNVSSEKCVTRRLLGQHFPYASYSLTFECLDGALGISFICKPDEENSFTSENVPSVDIYAEKTFGGYRLCCDIYEGGKLTEEIKTEEFSQITASNEISVDARGDEFDVFAEVNGEPVLLHSFGVKKFGDIRRYVNFSNCIAALYTALPSFESQAVVKKVQWYLDGGMAHADMKPIRYEDGMPMIEDGRIFLTMSSRLVKGGYQSVISLNPSACDFKLEGALFFDAGDGIWCADVASSVIYDRRCGKYLIWMCSFSHDHILARGTAEADIRYGINVIDVELMDVESYAGTDKIDGTDLGGAKKRGEAVLSNEEDFLGKSGDEDPDFYFDSDKNKWYLTICRQAKGAYEYFRFESDNPLDGYRFVARTGGHNETGGSTVKVGSRRYFVCGAEFDIRAKYNVYDVERLSECHSLICDYDDGGFRGWGTIIPLWCGSRRKYLWITFDRHLGSPTYNWSYGNIYVYEAIMPKGEL